MPKAEGQAWGTEWHPRPKASQKYSTLVARNICPGSVLVSEIGGPTASIYWPTGSAPPLSAKSLAIGTRSCACSRGLDPAPQALIGGEVLLGELWAYWPQ